MELDQVELELFFAQQDVLAWERKLANALRFSVGNLPVAHATHGLDQALLHVEACYRMVSLLRVLNRLEESA